MSFFYRTIKRKDYHGNEEEIEYLNFPRLILTAGALFACLGATLAAGCPAYNVYHSRKAGEAELAQADYSKQVAVQTAKAKNEAATYEAQAEITRAKGVAQANKIIGDSLKNNEAYLRYLFVNNLESTKNQVIYIPTEASLPILEAGKKPVQEDEK